MTLSARSVLPSPSGRHYTARKRAPQDLAMSYAPKPSEYRLSLPICFALRAVLSCLAAICCALSGSLLSCLTWQPVPRPVPGASAQLLSLSSLDLPLSEIQSLSVPSPSGRHPRGLALPLLVPAALPRLYSLRPILTRYVNQPVYIVYIIKAPVYIKAAGGGILNFEPMPSTPL
jgi:hypothetical protein